MGYFVLKSKIKLSEAEIGQRFEESDYSTLTEDGTFCQMEYVEDSDSVLEPTIVKPGIFYIVKTMQGLKIEKTAYTDESILKDFVNTRNITDKVDKFFSKIEVYYRYGITVPKRGILLYGPPGAGKSTAIAELSRQYGNDGKTFVLLWHTDKFDAADVKDFIKSFHYEGVERMILVVEDIGGIEIDQARIRSESSLLALLDNQEATFRIPVAIIATTNYIANYMENLTNRPNRFDDKIEVGYPNAAARAAIAKFFDKENILTEEDFTSIKSKKCDEFTPAHLKEIVIRSAIYDKSAKEVITEMLDEIKKFKAGFQERKVLGMMGGYDD
jgi:ATP-dependent 26S proteasome regulatory subunit